MLQFDSRQIEHDSECSNHKMKKRLIITIVVGVSHLVGSFFSARSIFFLTLLSCPPSSLVLGLFFFLGLFAVTIWNIVGVFRLWRVHKIRAFTPLALCIVFFYFSGWTYDLGLRCRIAEFKANLSGFENKAEAVVEELHARSLSKGEESRSNHFGNHAGFNVYAETDTNGVPTVRFVRVITMNFHHRGYMYRPDGKFDAILQQRGGWVQAPINDKWCAIGD